MIESGPEFSHLINVSRLPPNGIEESIEAKPNERSALAGRFDLIELRSLKARLDIKPGTQGVTVTGKMHAEVVQRCVVTLEPLVASIDLDVETYFVPAERYQEGAGKPFPEDLEEEWETFSGGKIDLGEMIAQHLGINLDPYPRKKNAQLAATEFGSKIERQQPFAQLAVAVKKKKKQDKTED